MNRAIPEPISSVHIATPVASLVQDQDFPKTIAPAQSQETRRILNNTPRTDGHEGRKPSFCRTPDTFQGEGNMQWKNWEEYLMHYNVVSDRNAWSDTECTDELLMSLKGNVADLVCPTLDNYLLTN